MVENTADLCYNKTERGGYSAGGGFDRHIFKKRNIMSKRKKIIIALIAAVLLLGIGVATFFIIKHFQKQAQIEKIDIVDTLPDGHGKKATVILLAGQSNASGCSHDEYLQKNVSAEQYEEYVDGYDNVYINYFVSDTNISEGFVTCAAYQGEARAHGGRYFGPELGLAEKLNEQYPDQTFFIIKYAWGGTNLYEQWLSPSSRGAVGSLYQDFVQYVQSSLEYLESKHYDVSIESMCWMQGESDALDEGTARNYEEHLSNLIRDVRAEFADYASQDGIAFVDAYISDSSFWMYHAQINQAKQAVADASPMNVVVDTIAHGLSVSAEPEGEPDIAHYDSLSELKLGYLFAEESAKFFD